MADGTIRIDITVDGKDVKVASGDLNKLGKSGHESGKGIGEAEKGMNKAGLSAKQLAISLGLVKIASAAFNVLKQSLDSAISRFDTLNKFPKVLQSLGVSAEDSERSISKLSSGIDGLPTLLNDIAATAQRMYTSFNDMDKATDSALALNNAMLGSGSSAADAQRGTDQYLQVLQRGKMEMQEWKTLQETMDVGLIKIAEGFGFAGKSAKDDLYSALQNGTITMDQFNDKLIEVGTGTGVMAQLAKENSLGLATSLSNLKNAAARGIADIIDSFNKLSIAITGKDIAQNIDGLKVIVNSSFKAIGSAIEATAPVIAMFASGVKGLIPIVNALTPAIVGLMTAYAAYQVITKTQKAISASNAVLEVAKKSKTGLTLVTKAHTLALASDLKMTQAQTTATIAQTGAVNLGHLAIGVLTGKIGLMTAAKTVAAAATAKLGAVMTVLSGPVGWVIAGIAALTAGAVLLAKWFKRSTEEGEELKNKTEELSGSVEESANKVNESSKAYDEQSRQLEVNAKAQNDLMQQIIELSEKEEKSAADKQLLADKIEQLNGEVEGLGLAYNEESEALNLSNEQMQARIGLQEDQSQYIDANERLLEISKEQHEVDMKMQETNELIKQNNEALEEGSITKNEHKKINEELTETEGQLKEAHSQLGEQYVVVEGQMSESMAGMEEALASGAISQSEMVDSWVEKNEELVSDMRSSYEEIYNITTDAFSRINDESKLSAEDMLENLKHNQKMMADWGDNISELMGFASEHGHENFLHWLETLGPDSAAEVAVISDMSDKELAEFATTMEKGADVSTEAFGKSLGEGMEDSAQMLGDHVTGLGDTMQSAAKDANFDQVGKDIVSGFVGGIDSSKGDAEKATKGMAKDSTDAAKSEFGVQSPSTIFKGIGGDLTKGLALGVKSGTNEVVSAIKSMFSKVEASSKVNFNNITRSYDMAVKNIGTSLSRLPSITQQHMDKVNSQLQASTRQQKTAMDNINKQYDTSANTITKSLDNLTTSMTRSMGDMLNKLKIGGNQQISFMRTMPSKLVSPFNNISSQFSSIGRSAMDGLNSGLYSRSGTVMATARSIANNIRATMRSALSIHSPSRVMRDDVGKPISEGLALGIDKEASAVYKAISKINEGIMRTATPEFALATSGMRFNAPVTPQSTTSYTTIVNEDKGSSSGVVKATFVIDGREAGKAVAPYSSEEMELNDIRREL